ncbi:MAG: type III secretion system chaperone [Pseudomonadota bacterium]
MKYLIISFAVFAFTAFVPHIAAHAQDNPDAQAEPESTAPNEIEPEAAPEDEEIPETVAAAIELLTIVGMIDDEAEIAPNGASFTLNDVPVTLVFDVNADRMRLISQIRPSDGLSAAVLKRMMQANFDSALDARYAIAQGQLWSTFIHPLSSLTQEDFVSGIAQTVTLVETYGTTYTSGAGVFGGGDSADEIQKQLENLLEGKDI